MGKLERITVTMPEEMVRRLRAAVDSGEYATTSEIVREALRDWSDIQDTRERKLTQLRAMIEQGLKGEARDGETVMANLRARVVAEAKRRA